MISVEAMLLRRRVVAVSAARHRPRPVRPARPPAGLVVEFTRTWLDLSREMDRVITETLAAERLVRRDAPDGGDGAPLLLPSQLGRLLVRLTELLDAFADRHALRVVVDQLAGRVAAWSRSEFGRQLAAALGVELVGDPDLRALLAAFRARNLGLVRSLAEDKVARVREVLEAAPHGLRAEVLAARIQAATGATTSRAALIARDQVLRLNAEVTRARHLAAGITEYTWSTSRDERVRPGHAELEGQRFAYADPPVVDERTGRRANPGEDVQCRCTADPILPSFA